MFFLTFAFFIVAILYAGAGFAGGSTYLALLACHGLPYEIFPILALGCNLIVSTGGCYQFLKSKQLDWPLTLPFVISSVPCAFLAGSITISQYLFFLILSLSLIAAGVKLLLFDTTKDSDETTLGIKFYYSLPIGALLGGVAGLVGIGGGIFLAPVMHLMRWGNARAIAATASFFILVNSIAGLSGQLIKRYPIDQSTFPQYYHLLFVAVLIGGQIGSRAATQWLSLRMIRGITGLLVLLVGIRILFNEIL